MSDSKAEEKRSEDDRYEELWKKKNDDAMEAEFQKNLRVWHLVPRIGG